MKKKRTMKVFVCTESNLHSVEEKCFAELINVVDGSDSEVESGTTLPEGAIKEEEETISLPHPAGTTEIIPDSTTIHMESSDNIVTSTHSKGLDTNT